MAPKEGSREVGHEEVEATSLDDQFLCFFFVFFLGCDGRLAESPAEDENADR